MYFSDVPGIVKWLMPSSLEWKVSSQEKNIYLTFDDGPIPEVTPWVVDVLRKYQAKATFFCVGENVYKHPEVYSMVQEAGHRTGNHSYNHLKGWSTPYHEYLENVARCQELVKSPLFRPPHGQITLKLARALRTEYRIIMWSMLSRDFDRNITPETCLRNAINKSRPGTIIVFHDSLKARDRLEYTLPRYIEHYSTQGYRFPAL